MTTYNFALSCSEMKKKKKKGTLQDEGLRDKERPKKGKPSGVGLYIQVECGQAEPVSVPDLVGKEPMYCKTQWCRMGVGRKAVGETGGDKTNRILT